MRAEEIEIRENFDRMKTPLTRKNGFTNGFEALSQYGYCLQDGFESANAAEMHTIQYYLSRMNLIRQ